MDTREPLPQHRQRCLRERDLATATRADAPVQWVGADPESDSNECPAVAVMPETGDFLFRGKTVTDQAVITVLNQHIGKADDESDVWLPARMASLIRQALDGYEQNRHGPGQHTLAELTAAAHACIIRFEALGSAQEKETGQASDCEAIRAAVARGVQVRRLQVVPALREHEQAEPGHAENHVPPREDVRYLSRAGAVGLLLPGADCWVFDYRVVRWDFEDTGRAGSRCCAFSSDPRVIRDIAAAFELAWSRTTTHE